MEMKELVDLTPQELIQREKQLRKELFNLRFQLVSGRVESPARIRQVRRDIARVKTVFNMKRVDNPL
ncbi:MAG: 50S ribosomal protein L29 [Nitrospiria bacterium]